MKGFIFGVLVGGAVGAYISYRYTEKKLTVEYTKKLNDKLKTGYISETEKIPEKKKPETILKEAPVKDIPSEVPVNPLNPYIITAIEFADHDDEYRSDTLTWYSKDHILANTVTGDIVEDIEETVGWDSIRYFDQCEEEDSVYVRNEGLGFMYEIIRSDNRYSDMVSKEDDE